MAKMVVLLLMRVCFPMAFGAAFVKAGKEMDATSIPFSLSLKRTVSNGKEIELWKDP